MRVLFGIDTWGLVGGTERYAADVVPALEARGHEVCVLCREAHGGGPAPDLAHVPVLADEAFGEGHEEASELARMARRARELEPDVVFLQTARNPAALAALAEVAPVVRFVHDHTLFCPGLNKYREYGELCEKPLGLECLSRYWLKGGCVCFKKAGHSSHVIQPLRELFAKQRELAIHKKAAALVTNSEYMRGELVRAGMDPARVVALPMFTRSNSPAQPAGELPEPTRSFVADGEGPLLFTPARLTLPDKGVDYLLSALALLERPFRAVIAGTGPAEEWLRQKAAEEGVAERTHFTGWLDLGAVEALYAAADLVVCPSVWNEPFGLVGLEAMAHEKPVVAFSVGGIPEWLDEGVTGLMAPRRDAWALSRNMLRILEDEALAQRMGQAGRERLERQFTHALHLDRLEAVLDGAVAD